MEIIDRDTFFKLTSTFEIVPHSQTRGIYNFHTIGGEDKIRFFVNDKANPTIACMGHEKRMLTKKMLLIEGECYLSKTDFENRKKTNQYISTLSDFYTKKINLKFDIIEIVSNTKWNFHYETALRLAGFLRPIGTFSFPSTKIIDLKKPIDYDRNWSRNLKKSEIYDLNLEILINPNEKDCMVFCSIYNAMCNRKMLTNQLTTQQIFHLCSDARFKLFFVSCEGERIATIIIYTDEKKLFSEGIFAGSTNKALETHATFFMYDSVFRYLKEQSYAFYDMAKLIPTTIGHKVFQFKNGILGDSIPLNGEFSWCKKQYYRPFMYFVKKYLMKKREL